VRTRATLAAQADVMASVRAQAVGTGAGAQRIGWAVVWVQAGGYKGSGGYGGGAEGYLVVGDGDGPPFKGSSLCASMYV
jgi:hypothetical protein